MENLIFSLNATMPIFLLMVVGYFLNRIGWMDDDLAQKLNKFVFRLPLPMTLFVQLSGVDILKAWDTGYIVFCFVVTLLSILIAALLSLLIRDRGTRGEFIQASYRSSAALIGIAFIENIYGQATMASLMIVGAVPLYNVAAVLVLTMTDEESAQGGVDAAARTAHEVGAHDGANSAEPAVQGSVGTAAARRTRRGVDSALMKRTLKGVVTNPIIIGIVAGAIWSLLKIPRPQIFVKLCSDIGATATPLGLMAMGATFDFRKAFGEVKPALLASFMKLFGYDLLFLPLAIKLGYTGEKLVSILVMLGSATTVSCYVMARNMHHEGVLTSSVVAITTLFSAFSLTFWLFLVRSMGLI